jgi:hypothetical protein
MSVDALKAAEAKMRDAGQSEEAIRSFASAYERLESGESALLPTAELEPAGEVDTLEQLPDADASDILDRVAVIKLNGGLATSMGLRSPKSLVEARDGHSFLDIIVGQTLALRARYGVPRGDGARAGGVSRARRWVAARLPSEHGSQARRRDARADHVDRQPRARVEPARAR